MQRWPGSQVASQSAAAGQSVFQYFSILPAPLWRRVSARPTLSGAHRLGRSPGPGPPVRLIRAAWALSGRSARPPVAAGAVVVEGVPSLGRGGGLQKRAAAATTASWSSSSAAAAAALSGRSGWTIRAAHETQSVQRNKV
jgi:hypothetical protein